MQVLFANDKITVDVRYKGRDQRGEIGSDLEKGMRGVYSSLPVT